MSVRGWTRREVGRAALMAGAVAASPALFGQHPFRHKKEKNEAVDPIAPSVTGTNSLRAHAAARGLLYGAAVVPSLLDVDGLAAGSTNDAYTQLVSQQCNILVAENAMKWASLRPAPDRFEFSDADKLMRFADLAGQRVRGHNLCWHEALPAWFKDTATKDNARQI